MINTLEDHECIFLILKKLNIFTRQMKFSLFLSSIHHLQMDITDMYCYWKNTQKLFSKYLKIH